MVALVDPKVKGGFVDGTLWFLSSVTSKHSEAGAAGWKICFDIMA